MSCISRDGTDRRGIHGPDVWLVGAVVCVNHALCRVQDRAFCREQEFLAIERDVVPKGRIAASKARVVIDRREDGVILSALISRPEGALKAITTSVASTVDTTPSVEAHANAAGITGSPTRCATPVRR